MNQPITHAPRASPQLVGEKEALCICREKLPRVVGKITLRHWRETVEGLYVRPVTRGFYVVPVLLRKLNQVLEDISD